MRAAYEGLLIIGGIEKSSRYARISCSRKACTRCPTAPLPVTALTHAQQSTCQSGRAQASSPALLTRAPHPGRRTLTLPKQRLSPSPTWESNFPLQGAGQKRSADNSEDRLCPVFGPL